MAGTRHDYEGLDAGLANILIEDTRRQLRSLNGRRCGSLEVSHCDDFAYVDPVGHSRAEHQGLRVMFSDDARIVYRPSGTGTAGVALRVYLERFERDPARQDGDPRDALAGLAAIAQDIAQIASRTGRRVPSVIT